MQDDGTEHTVIRPRVFAPYADRPVGSAEERDVVDGDTVIPPRRSESASPGSRRATREASGGAAVPVPPPAPTPADRADEPDATSSRYRFSINGGRPVPLDLPAILGRRPRSARIAHGVEPRLIPVDSPQQETSGSHVALAQEGTAVVVTDLRSTNGTTVTLPSGEQVRLRPGESYVAVPGSLIDIGDGNIVEILAVERLVPDLSALAEITQRHGPGRTP